MATDISSYARAVSAYQNNLGLGAGGDDSAATAGLDDAKKPSFMDMLGGALNDAITEQKQTEQMKLASVTGGKVDMSSLVTAVANAELTLNTVVAIRDRVISAYQDIIRMAI